MGLYRKQYGQPDPEGKLGLQWEGRNAKLAGTKDDYCLLEVGYWRKANQIHRWFVENVQGGKDDCKSYEVSRAQLGELLETVYEVLKSINLVPGTCSVGQRPGEGEGFDSTRRGFVVENPEVAKKLLPIQEGFFFGSYLYDSWYFEGLVVTKDILEEVLQSPPDSEFFYQSSW